MGASLLAWSLMASPARAQEIAWPEVNGPSDEEGWWDRDPNKPAPPPPPDPDPMVATGIALTSVSGATIIAGTAMLATAGQRGETLCGLSGCFRQPDHDYRIGALSLLTSGVALGFVGAGVWLGGATGKPRTRYRDGWVVAGSTLTGLGLSTAAAGVSALVAQSTSVQLGDRSAVEPWAALLIGVGGTASIVGIPLWAVGAQDWKPEPEPKRVRPYSPRMKTTGIVLTSLGVASFLGAGGAFVAAIEESDFSGGLGLAVLSSGLNLGGIVLTGIGIPLWAVGAHDKVIGDDDDDALNSVPELRVGPGNMEMTWSF